jgi:hypothetical protein
MYKICDVSSRIAGSDEVETMWTETIIVCSLVMSNTRKGELRMASKTSKEVISTPIEVQTHYLRNMKPEYYPPNRNVWSKQIIHKLYNTFSFTLLNMEIAYTNYSLI